jgi:hypothetical protein
MAQTHHHDSHDSTLSPWNFTAAIAAWLLPGLGHYLLGQRRRGGILAASIGVLWLGGLVIGGIGSFDRSQMTTSIVQIGQYGLGPSILLHEVHNWLTNSGRYEPALSRVQEQAVLYTALAGMLNLLAVMDVMYRDPRKPRLTPNGDLALDAPHPKDAS